MCRGRRDPLRGEAAVPGGCSSCRQTVTSSTVCTEYKMPTIASGGFLTFSHPCSTTAVSLSMLSVIRVFTSSPRVARLTRCTHCTMAGNATSTNTLPTDSSLPGENFEVRQTHTSDDYHPNPSKSINLLPNRQALLDDIIALYSCQPTRRRVERYTPDCVYDDQFVYANDRYKMAGQWFALPKLFKASVNEGYEVVVNEPGLIQFKNEQVRIAHTVSSAACLRAYAPDRLGPSQEASSLRPSTPSYRCHSIPRPKTQTLSRSSTTRIRQTTRITRTQARASHLRSGRPTRLRVQWIARMSNTSKRTRARSIMRMSESITAALTRLLKRPSEYSQRTESRSECPV